MTDVLSAVLLLGGWLALSYLLIRRAPWLPSQIATLISAAVIVGVATVLGLN